MAKNTSYPPMRSSDEANKKQLEMARAQGQAMQEAAEHMMKEEADDGAAKHVGDYLIGYAVETAEGMYMPDGDDLVWQAPDEENLHVEVVVADASDKRFIPGLTVHATLIGPDGKKVGTHQQPFLWHPWLYHYGRNWKVPGDGTYKLRVEVERPTFGRHDKENGKRFAEGVTVEFDNVQVKTGQK